jgi:hypothetical protein
VTIPRYAIIPTRNRHEQLISLLKSLEGRIDVAYVIDNAGDEPLSSLWLRQYSSVRTIVHRDDEQPPHLYKMWNFAFRAISVIAKMGVTKWDVAVFNDDTVIPEGWYDYVSDCLRSRTDMQPAVACTYAYPNVSDAIMLKTQVDGNIMTRMCPWAFVVRGELGLRADESMRWWWGDTDFEWQAIQAGGVLMLPGYITQNTLANSTTHGALAEQAGRDGETFTLKWGRRPW